MTQSERGSMWVGALLGAVGMALVWDWLTPSHEKVTQRVWKSGSLLDTIDEQSTGDLVLIKRWVLFELECRTDRAEVEALLQPGTLQVVPWCRNPALRSEHSEPPRK